MTSLPDKCKNSKFFIARDTQNHEKTYTVVTK